MKIRTATIATIALLALAASGATARAQVTEGRETIAYDGARQIVETCRAAASTSTKSRSANQPRTAPRMRPRATR